MTAASELAARVTSLMTFDKQSNARRMVQFKSNRCCNHLIKDRKSYVLNDQRVCQAFIGENACLICKKNWGRYL